MIKGKKCETCNGSGMVRNPGFDDGSFSPPTMPCYAGCGGTGRIGQQPQSTEEAAVMLADALQLATEAKARYQNLQHVYSRWVHGVSRDEDGHRL